jgi:hypothetical protein
VCWSQSRSPPAATCSIIKTSTNTQPCHFHAARSLLSQSTFLAVCYYSDPVILVCLISLPDNVFLSTTILPALTLVPVSSPTSRYPATLSWIPHSGTPLDSPPDMLTLSQPQPQPPHLVSSNLPKLPLTCTPLSPCVSINTFVTSSQSPRLSLLLGSPVPLRVTVRSGQRDEPSRLCYSPPNPRRPRCSARAT